MMSSFLWKSTAIIRALSMNFVPKPPKNTKNRIQSAATVSTTCYGITTRAKERTTKNKTQVPQIKD